MLENKKVFIPRIGEEVHVSRLIASWLNDGGNLYEITLNDEGEIDYRFRVWLQTLGIEEEDIHYVWNFAMNGKLELETLAKRFRKTHEVLDE